MTKNNNSSNYKLHEFLGSEEERQKLHNLYYDFFARSKPLDFQSRTLSDQKNKLENYFRHLTERSKIIIASQEDELIGFICFDPDSKTLEIPHGEWETINRKEMCEFVFAASKKFNRTVLPKIVGDIFQLIKSKYNVKYIVGNVRRKHKKRQYIITCQKIFNFKIVEDFVYHEIP